MLVTGCAATRRADFISPEFVNIDIDRVLVLPIVDHRIDQPNNFDFADFMPRIVERSLNQLGYSFSRTNQYHF
jgi:hypothetical protein